MKRRYLAITILSVLALCIGIVGKWPVKLIYNPTESAPKGFYLIVNSAIQKGDYVLADIPEMARKLAARRQYLPRKSSYFEASVGYVWGTYLRQKPSAFYQRKAYGQAFRKGFKRQNTRVLEGLS